MLALGLLASEKNIFEVVLYKQMTHWGMVNLGPKGLICRIYVRDH